MFQLTHNYESLLPKRREIRYDPKLRRKYRSDRQRKLPERQHGLPVQPESQTVPAPVHIGPAMPLPVRSIYRQTTLHEMVLAYRKTSGRQTLPQ